MSDLPQSLECFSAYKCFGGMQKRFRHQSDVLDCEMVFAVFEPPQMTAQTPVLYYLSGLTCTDENFVQKAGAQRLAAELGLVIIAPDTSPRGAAVADDDAYDLGQGAGFYINATEAPWAAHYQMESYIVEELPKLIHGLGYHGKTGICGHSMGGHGAITLALKHPQQFYSVSAFSPIGNPTECPWGEKAFNEYLGSDKQCWRAHDASLLLRANKAPWPIRIDVGLADQFLDEQLGIDALQQAASASGSDVRVYRHEGYDHSYFFIASFMAEHLQFHAEQLAG